MGLLQKSNQHLVHDKLQPQKAGVPPDLSPSVSTSHFAFSDPFYRHLSFPPNEAARDHHVSNKWFNFSFSLLSCWLTVFSIPCVIWFERSANKATCTINLPPYHRAASGPRRDAGSLRVFTMMANTRTRQCLTPGARQSCFGAGQSQQTAFLQVQSSEVAGDGGGPHTLLPHQICVFIQV